MKALPYTIRKLRHRPGTLYVDFRYGGKRHCLALGTLDKHVAKVKAEELYKRTCRGATGGSRVSMNMFLSEYRAWRQLQKSPRTIEVEESVLRRWLAVCNKEFIADINERDVDAFITQLAASDGEYRFRDGKVVSRGSRMSPTTIRTYVRTLSSIFRMAKRWKYIERNPFLDAPLPKVERPMPRTYTLDEVRAILAATAEHAPECLDVFVIYFVTGMRASEALRLEWSDVDFERGLIQLRKTKGKKVRFVPMGPIARRVLLARRGLERPFGRIRRSSGLQRQRVLTQNFLSKQFKRMAEIAGIRNAKLKFARGTYATALLEIAHLSPLAVQEIIGHADISTTQRHYFNPLNEVTLERSTTVDSEFERLLPVQLRSNAG